MKYNINAMVYQIAFTKMLKDYYNTNKPNFNLDEVLSSLKKEYKEMVQRTPGLNGNSNEANLIGACYFFAIAKVVPDMTPELMDDIIYKSIKSDFMVKLHKGKKEKGTLFSEKEQNKKLKEAEASHTSKHEMDWEFTYEKGNNEFYMTYTRCGICKLAKIEHMEEYLPCMCKMDFPKYELVGGKLLRDKTLANGDECCNFHVIKQ